jgi:hypothetical protein
MTDKEKVSRFDWLMANLGDASERAALQAEYDHFFAGPDESLDEEAKADADRQYEYSIECLHTMIDSAKATIPTAISSAFAWNASLAGDDFWNSVYWKYENQRRDAVAARIKGATDESKAVADAGTKEIKAIAARVADALEREAEDKARKQADESDGE